MRATALLEAGGRVDGVRFESASGTHQVRADKAVVIATGGFEHDPELARDFLRGPIGHPPGVPSNTGDGLRMAMRLGARLSAMREAWWMPVVLTRAADGTSAPALLLRERTLPGTLMVNGQGRRFTDEAANYNALGAAFHAFDVTTFTYANDPAWLVLDDACVKKYGVFGNTPGNEAPGWLIRADTLDEFVGRIGVPADALSATVRRFNDGVQAGHDPEFHRGESVYDGWVGDQTHYRTPRATLGRVATGPFYATRVHPSTLRTKGGPRTTTDGQVLRVDDTVIDGLYAVGNAMAAPTGVAYGGSGGTLARPRHGLRPPRRPARGTALRRTDMPQPVRDSLLFQPIRIGTMGLRNRIMLPPHGSLTGDPFGPERQTTACTGSWWTGCASAAR